MDFFNHLLDSRSIFLSSRVLFSLQSRSEASHLVIDFTNTSLDELPSQGFSLEIDP